jgi:hypothetical protein
MKAVDANDLLWGLPVQYYFECVSGDCHKSGWQSSATYTDVGLLSGVEYAYSVKARDQAANETKWSTIRYAMIGGDQEPPSPNPMTWATLPYAATATSVRMVATTAHDDSGVIEYEFNETTGTGHDSVWRSDPCYLDTGLDANGAYCYRVRARDKYNNTTGWSAEVCVSNLGDPNPPAPPPVIVRSRDINNISLGWTDPNIASGQFMYTEYPVDYRWWHRVIVDVTGVADDSGGPVEIRFICTTDDKFSSNNKIPVSLRPIYIGQPVAIGSRAAKWRVTYTGSYIVYDVDVDKVAGSGKQLFWKVCAYDAALNEACSSEEEIRWPPIQ